MPNRCCFVPPARRDRPGDVQVVPGYLLNTSSLIIQTCRFTYVRFPFKAKKYLIFTALIASSSYIFVMTFFTEKKNERALPFWGADHLGDCVDQNHRKSWKFSVIFVCDFFVKDIVSVFHFSSFFPCFGEPLAGPDIRSRFLIRFFLQFPVSSFRGTDLDTWCQLKGVWHEIFSFKFFHESVSQKDRSFRIFSKICGDIRGTGNGKPTLRILNFQPCRCYIVLFINGRKVSPIFSYFLRSSCSLFFPLSDAVLIQFYS